MSFAPLNGWGTGNDNLISRFSEDHRESIEDSVALQVVVIILSLISAVTSFIVAVSYIHLMRIEHRENKKKLSSRRALMNGGRVITSGSNNSRNRLLSLCFVLCTFCVSILTCLEPISRSNFSNIHPGLCRMQGGCILFFMHCMVWLWLSIMLRLFLVLVCNIRYPLPTLAIHEDS